MRRFGPIGRLTLSSLPPMPRDVPPGGRALGEYARTAIARHLAGDADARRHLELLGIDPAGLTRETT